MKILFLTAQIPYPPEGGAALRNWGLISGLAARHEVAVLSFCDPARPPAPDGPLAETCRVEVVAPPLRASRDRLRALLATRRPDMALRLASRAYARRLEGWLARESFDAVHVGGIEMAPYLDLARVACPRPLVVFDEYNCEYRLQQRAFLLDLRAPARWPGAAYSLVQWLRLRRYEAQVCRLADRVLAVSDLDAEALRGLVPGLDVTVVSNGVHVESYRPQASGEPPVSHQTLVFTGTMDFRPNVDAVLWFTRRVFPRVRAEVPDVRFAIVGQRPHPRLAGLGRAPGVTVTGRVDDVRPYIAEAALYVAPLRVGGGTRFKLLEALAMEKAVVSTHLGAEGIPVTHEREVLLADTPAGFAAAVVSLLRQPRRRVELGRAGRALVEERFDWSAIVPRLEAVYGKRSAAAQAGTGSPESSLSE
jgi:sugar transferase (PEP-CTERM/EpsH1 system associated)